MRPSSAGKQAYLRSRSALTRFSAIISRYPDPTFPRRPQHYFRKQTLVNAERFITEELKEFEIQVLEADEKRLELEEQLFVELRQAVSRESGRIQEMAEIIADLDCLGSLAEVAAKYDYCRPEVDSSDSIHIRDGRHPVIERFLPEGGFVPKRPGPRPGKPAGAHHHRPEHGRKIHHS